MNTILLKTISIRKNKSVLNKLVLFFLIISGFNQNLNAQVSNYTVDQEQVVPATIPLITPRTLLSPSATITDNAVYPLALPFDFTFSGVLYTAGTNVNVSTNGFITFGPTAPAANLYTPISSATGYEGAISIYGADLTIPSTPASYGLGWNVSGAAGSQILKIEWVCRRNVSGESTAFVMQLWLYEGTNVIEMKYRNFNPTTPVVQGEVGLRGNNNADFNNFNYSTVANWPGIAPSPIGTMPAGTANNQTVVTKGASGQIQTSSNKLFRFTPVSCSSPTGLNVPFLSITSSTATLNWNAPSPAPALGYDYYVTTSATVPNAGTTPTGSVLAGVLTAGLTGLTPGALQYVYVRAKCSGSDISSWSLVYNFTTFCNPTNVPYYQPFNNGVTTNTVVPYHGVLPTCTSQQNLGSGNNWVTTYSDTYYPDAAMDEYVLMYNGLSPGNANAANVWFYTEGINMTAGTTYRLSYYYGGTFYGIAENKMEVAYFTSPINSALVSQLDNHTSIKGSSFENIVNFTPTTTGVYYIGFRAYSNNSQGQLYVDDIQVVLSACKKPTAVSVSSISASTAVLSWTPPTPAPGSGYAYYYNTTGSAPTNSTIPNGFTATGVNSVTLTGLTGSTTYYFWVRGNCGFGEFGEWVALDNAGNPFFTTLVAPPSYCTPSGATFAQDPNGITNVNMGSINNTSGIEVNNYGNYTNLITNVAQGATIPVNITFATGFTYFANIWVDWNNDGDFVDTGELVYTGQSLNANPTTLPASFAVPALQPLGAYRLRIGSIDDPVFTGGALTPCRNGAYQAFEDYTINVIVAPPLLTINQSTSTQCAGVATSLITLTTPISNFDTYSWSPSTGVTGDAVSGWTISSNTSLTYILTGVQSTSPFSTNTTSFAYVANQPPTPITLSTPSGTTVCTGGTPVPIVSSGGVVNGFVILEENFNGATNSWTVAGTGTGSPVGNWTLRPDGYTIPLGAKHSNDNTQFYEADSDSPGIGTAVTTTLTSPAFSTIGYTSLSLSYYHTFNNFSGDTAKVQVSTNGTIWTDLITYTTDQGTNTIFAHEPGVVLDAYIGQATVYIRFRYDATWDWFWAIDNVKVSGSSNTDVVWNSQTSPVANGVAVPGLYTSYTSASVNTPYIAGTIPGVATVYALPTADETFTASASTISPVCTTTANVSLTVNSGTVGGSVTGGTTICSGSTSGLLTLAGYTGSIVRWESSVAPFSTWTPIVNTAATYTSGALTQTTQFRAVVQSGSCPTANSAVTTVTVSPTTVGGSVTGGTTICSGSTSGLLTLAGYTGSIVRWESSVAPFSTWTPIVNTAATYTSGALTQTTQFRAVVQSGSCPTANSAVTTVTVSPTTVGGSVTGGTTICSGSTSGLLTLAGYTGSIVRWESSVAPFSTWTPIVNTAATYTSGALTQTTQFRAVVQSGTCPTANSAVTTVTVTTVNGGTASGDQTFCYGQPTDLSLSGFIGTISGWESADDLAFTVGLTSIPLSASATLTSAQMGSITSDKYFRALVISGTCSAYSTIVHVTYSSTTWNGTTWSNGTPDATKVAVFNGNYTSSSNLNACSVLVNSGNVLFLSNHNLIIENDLNVAGGTLTFQNNASLVQVNDIANLPGNTNGGNIGGIIYYRDTTPVRKKDYTYWSSPVSPQTLFRLSPSTPAALYYKFDPAITNNWVSVPSSNLMDAGKGYIIRAPNIAPFTNTTFNVFHAYFDGSGFNDGVPNNGTITTPIAVGLGDANLIGNPYPSGLSADDFLSYGPNTSVVDGTILLWTHNTAITANQYSTDDYAMYNYSGGIGTGTAAVGLGVNNNIPNGYIASGQGFFIKGLANGVATFQNNMRVVGNNNQFFRMSSKSSNASFLSTLEKNRVWLELSNNQGAFKQTMVGYIENATNDLDRGFDGLVLEAGNLISFYSLVTNNKLGIQGRALPFDNNDIVPLGYRSTLGGNFTIKLSNFDGFFDTTNVYLEDLLLNVIHDLKQSDYNFVTDAGTYEGRFQLRYTNSTLANTNFNFNDNTVIVYKNNSDIVVNSSNTYMSNVKVFDVRGRQLFDSKQINNNEYTISKLNSAEQVLIVTVTSIDGVIVNKKIVF